MKKAEKEHIEAVGECWGRILIATTVAVRSSPRFTGLDKLRGPIAMQAALKAIGFGNASLIIPRAIGDNRHCQGVADEVFADAVRAGERAFVAVPA